MNTAEKNYKLGDVFVGCPHCLVHSLKLSKEECADIKAGQQMIEVCQVCGKEFMINEQSL